MGVLDFRSVDGALLRYRVVALIVSVALVVLFFIGIPLEHWGHHKGVDVVVGITHGIVLYPLYIILTFDLTRRLRMPPIQFLLTLAAGTIPIASFYAERQTTKFVRERQAALTHESSAAPSTA